MVSKETQAALDGTTKRAHAGDPKAPPNNTTRAKMASERVPAGFTPQPPPLSHPIASEGLDHHERAQAVESAKKGGAVPRTQDNRAPKA